MSILLASNIVPKNGNRFFLLDDQFLKGSYQAVPDVASRDSIYVANLKAGMLVHCVQEGITFRLNADGITWDVATCINILEKGAPDGVPILVGGSIPLQMMPPELRPVGGKIPTNSYSHTHVQTLPDSVWTIPHGLGFYPSVTVIVSENNVVQTMLPVAIEYTTLNDVVIKFSSPRVGQARLV